MPLPQRRSRRPNATEPAGPAHAFSLSSSFRSSVPISVRSVGRVRAVGSVARRWRRGRRRRYEPPPGRYPISHIYPVSPVSPINPVSVTGARRMWMWFRVCYSCAYTQSSEAEGGGDCGGGRASLQIHHAILSSSRFLAIPAPRYSQTARSSPANGRDFRPLGRGVLHVLCAAVDRVRGRGGSERVARGRIRGPSPLSSLLADW